jgi:hypothetical protein
MGKIGLSGMADRDSPNSYFIAHTAYEISKKRNNSKPKLSLTLNAAKLLHRKSFFVTATFGN